MSRLYVVLDVFTDVSLTGNPLAVVLDASGLDTSAMQAISLQFNLSETVFLLPAEDEARKARLRIFTPYAELPFAGHPTVGTAVLLGLMDAAAGKGKDHRFELEEQVGVVPCTVSVASRRAGRATFALPRLPEAGPNAPDAAEMALALGLKSSDIGFGRHAVSRHDAGNPFCFVPVASLDALGRAKVDPSKLGAALERNGDRGVYLYTAETGDPTLAYRARMLRPAATEDPATGSAAAAFAGVVAVFDAPGDGEHALRIGQGFEMGRASVIELGLKVVSGKLVSATIGGGAVVTAEGTLFVK